MASPTQITPAQLLRLIGTAQCPTIIDVRIDADFTDQPFLIPTAYRIDHRQMPTLATKLGGSKVVIYCQKGLKLSSGAAALLRTYGINAEVLTGGQFAWSDAGLPMIPASKISTDNGDTATLWVTKARPKIDRIACPWLIKRFIDPKSTFLFVPSSQVIAVAEKFDARSFDVDDAFYSHRGELCTFDTLLDEFGLHTEALNHLAKIIRGADTNRLDISPQSAGLLAISHGFSRIYSDDLAQLEASLPIYDALYRWCRDATGEAHDSLQSKSKEHADD